MKRALIVPGIIALALCSGEAVARFGLGLGTPPLYEADPALEYRMAPNQHLYRFGTLVETNERGMRSPRLAGETRQIVLVLGDSIPNGGSQTPQAELATSLLSNSQVVFANMSAGSWGPANELVALEQNLDLRPAAVVVVLNSQDLPDVPTFAPLDGDHPTKAPAFALSEALERYLPRYLPFLRGAQPVQQPLDYAGGRLALEALLDRLDSLAVPHCIVLHPTLAEVDSGPNADNREILSRINAHGIAVVDEVDVLQLAGGYHYTATQFTSTPRARRCSPRTLQLA